MSIHAFSENTVKKLKQLQLQLADERVLRGETPRQTAKRIGAGNDFIVVCEAVGPHSMSAGQRWARAFDLKLVIEHDHVMVMTAELAYIKERAGKFEDDEWTRQWAMKSLGTLRRQREIPGRILDERLGLKRSGSTSSAAWETKTLDPTLARYFAHADAADIDMKFKLFDEAQWAKRS